MEAMAIFSFSGFYVTVRSAPLKSKRAPDWYSSRTMLSSFMPKAPPREVSLIVFINPAKRTLPVNFSRWTRAVRPFLQSLLSLCESVLRFTTTTQSEWVSSWHSFVAGDRANSGILLYISHVLCVARGSRWQTTSRLRVSLSRLCISRILAATASALL